MLSSYIVDISPIELTYEYKKLQDYDFIVFAFPTYHCSPSSSIMEYINDMPAFDKHKNAFAFTTCGLYSGNALRVFIKKCLSKNIIINGYSIYKAPATDGALILSTLPFMFRYENKIAHKIKSDIKRIENIINTDASVVQCPPFKLYEILNYPNKIIGKAYKHKLRILKEYCVKCRRCADNCIRKCWNTDGEYPEYAGLKCEFCFKCVHHCPNGAIVLSAKTKSRIKFNEQFYKSLKEKILYKIF